MTGWRMMAALVATVLAAAPAGPVRPAQPPVAAATPTRPPFVPCPVVAPTGPVPQRPAPPPHVPGRPVIGGEGLDTAGLTLAPGAPPLPNTLSATYWLVADLDSGAGFQKLEVFASLRRQLVVLRNSGSRRRPTRQTLIDGLDGIDLARGCGHVL